MIWGNPRKRVTVQIWRRCIRYVGPYHRLGFHPGGASPLDQPGGVVEQDLVLTDVQQQRRQAAQVGVEWREQRIGGVVVADVGLDHAARRGRGQHGVDLRLGPQRFTGPGQVGHRREGHRPRRQRLAGIAQRHQQHQGQVASGGIAGDDDPLRGDLVGQQPAGSRTSFPIGKTHPGNRSLLDFGANL